MRKPLLCLAVLASPLPFNAAQAQDLAYPIAEPLRNEEEPLNDDDPEPDKDWQFRVGGALLYAPVFLGSRDYQLMAGPALEINYKDRFHLSPDDGIRIDLIKTDSLRVGPVVDFEQNRRESARGNFAIAGRRSTALRGLGNVGFTAEVGGYVEYEFGPFSTSVSARQGVNGHNGFIANIEGRYRMALSRPRPGAMPILFSLSARTSIVDAKYNSAYFGVDPAQSAQSGLGVYDAKGGILSARVGGALLVPLASSLSLTVLAGYDRVTGSAARSPLVRERGSRNQASVGLGLVYRFGL